MSRLLHAGLVRLKKDPLFWAGIVVMTLLEFFLVKMNQSVEQADSVVCSLNDVLFGYMFGVGFICAVFCSFFSGRDYQDGTIRNKLIAGHTKVEIYLSNLLINITASLCLCFFSFAMETTLGILLLSGRNPVKAGALVCTFLGSCLTVIAFCSIFTMVAMLDQNKSASDVICMAMACALLFSTLYVDERLLVIEGLEQTYGTKEEIEQHGRTTRKEYDKYISEISGLPEGDYGGDAGYDPFREIYRDEQMILNKGIYEFFYDALPYGQAIQYAAGEVKHLGRLCLYSMGWILVTTSFGVFVFRKKNIR